VKLEGGWSELSLFNSLKWGCSGAPVTSNSYRLDKKFSSRQQILTAKQGKKNRRADIWRWEGANMEDDDGGLFNIEVSSGDEAGNESEKVPRDFQSEEDFQRQRAEWKPKVEAGEVKFPLLSSHFMLIIGIRS
jgi:hypothetical protein